MSGASARATRGSGNDPEIDLWGLKDLPKTSAAKKTAPAPVRKGYTVKVDRKARNKDMWKLRREATVNELAVSSLPVYMVTGAPRTPHQEAAAPDGKRKDATAASVSCGASVRSTLQFGSMPVVNIYPSLLSEAEADHDLASLRREKWCSPCPEQFTYAQETGSGSAPVTTATARTREGVLAAVAVAAAMRLPTFLGDKTAARRTALDDGNGGSGTGNGGSVGGGAGSDGTKDSPVPFDTAGRPKAMGTMAAGRKDFRSDGKGDEHLVGGGANSSRAWYSEPYYRVSHAELASYYGVNHAETTSSRKRLLDIDGDGSDLDGLVASAGRGGGIVFHGRRGGGFGMETDSRFTEGRSRCSRMNKRMKAGICGGGAQGNGGSNTGGDGTKGDDSGGGGGGGGGGSIPIVSCSDSISGDSISGNSSSGSGGGSSGGGDACAKPPSSDSSIGEKRKRRDDDDGNEVICGSRDYDIKAAPGYDGDHEDCVIGTRSAGREDGVFRRTRGSRGQNKRSRGMTARP